MRKEFCKDIPGEKQVDGVFRDLEETVVMLAEFYLTTAHNLEWFGNEMTFLIAIGGDGAPLGKYTVQRFHSLFLDEALKRSDISDKCVFSELPQASAFYKYTQSLRNEVKARRLYKQIVKWFNNDRQKNKDFSYRFTGKDSKLILHGFNHLIKQSVKNQLMRQV